MLRTFLWQLQEVVHKYLQESVAKSLQQRESGYLLLVTKLYLMSANTQKVNYSTNLLEFDLLDFFPYCLNFFSIWSKFYNSLVQERFKVFFLCRFSGSAVHSSTDWVLLTRLGTLRRQLLLFLCNRRKWSFISIHFISMFPLYSHRSELWGESRNIRTHLYFACEWIFSLLGLDRGTSYLPVPVSYCQPSFHP